MNYPTSSLPASKKKYGKQLCKQFFKPINDKENQELFTPPKKIIDCEMK